MLIRISSLVLLILLAVSAMGGVPLHSPEQGECPMGGMEMMDCCIKAQQQQMSADVAAAKLCCALNCQAEGTVPTSGSFTPGIGVLPTSEPAGAVPVSLQAFFLNEDYVERNIPPDRDHPAYIRHLALLI